MPSSNADKARHRNPHRPSHPPPPLLAFAADKLLRVNDPDRLVVVSFPRNGLRREYKLVHRGHYLGRCNASSRPPPWERPPETPSAAAAPPSSPPRLCLWHWQTVAKVSAVYVVTAAAPLTPRYFYLPHPRPLVHGGKPASLHLAPTPPTPPDIRRGPIRGENVLHKPSRGLVCDGSVSLPLFRGDVSRDVLKRFVRSREGRSRTLPPPLSAALFNGNVVKQINKCHIKFNTN